LDVVVNSKLLPLQQIIDEWGIAMMAAEHERVALVVASMEVIGPSPVAMAKDRLQAINRFSILPEELVDLHFHYPTHTLTVFTDGSCIGESAAGAVYYSSGSKRNLAFSILVQPISVLVELHAIEEAILSSPSGVNLCVATDSLVAIQSIGNWNSWSEGCRRKFAGEAIVRHILKCIQAAVDNGRNVSFQHMYSHIPNKKKKARATSPTELARLKGKLCAMKDRLWGAHSQWTDGNVGADLLARSAHNATPVQEVWTMGREGRAVVLFDAVGREVPSNVRAKALAAEANKWPERMRRKPIRGKFLRDQSTSYRSTHDALDSRRHVDAA
jgi:ribonuclease HI